MKVIIVTGASRGIGLETVKIILNSNKENRVFATGRTLIKDSAQLQELSARHGDSRFRYFSVDHSRENSGKLVFEECFKAFNRIDGIVHSAGTLEPFAKIGNIKIEEFKNMMNVNLYAAIDLIQCCLRELRARKGSIVLVSSGAATKAYETWGAYCMSKAALNMLAASLGAEEPLITTTAVRPGVVDTQMQDLIREKGRDIMPQSLYEYFVGLKSEGKLHHPSIPSAVLADLAINPRPHLSGRFLNLDEIIRDGQ